MRAKPKPKPTRNTFTPELLVKQLAKDVPGFRRESKQVKAALASMVWIGATKHRLHTAHDGYMSFHYRELAAAFGGEFEAINARLEFLDVKHKFRFISRGDDTGGYTKGYKFSATVQASRDTFMSKRTARLTRLLDASGTGFRTLPKAVDSLDIDGVATTHWQAINAAGSLSRVPVSIQSLRLLHRRFAEDAATWRRTGHPPRDLFMECPSLESLLELREQVWKLIRLAYTDVAGLGYVLHHYKESPSGRMFTTGGASLQNAPKEIRRAALAGLWDYDVENCHFAIMDQMAEQVGVRCDAIKHYMANKKPVRAKIADTIGISKDQAKDCLLMVMYGAPTNPRAENAIPEAIGVAAARRLFGLPQFVSIATDVKLARKAILANHKINRQGRLVNDFGKSLKVKANAETKPKTKAKSPEQRLAHLIQGIEALALEACTELYPAEIVLLQHDGFTATTRLNVAALEQTISDATGYALKLEEELVMPDLADQYAKTAQSEFSKVRNTLKANAGAGLRPVSNHSMQANTALAP